MFRGCCHPVAPVAGATRNDPEEVKTMTYHGLCYSHGGLTDPAIMPAYVAKAKLLHEKAMEWTTLDPVLPKWTSLATYFGGQKWDLGADMQGHARPDGAEISMVYNKESNKWEPRPKIPKDAETSGKTKQRRQGRQNPPRGLLAKKARSLRRVVRRTHLKPRKALSRRLKM